MPNGNHELDRISLDAWFDPLRSALESFASKHGMQIDKYYHDSPSWSLQANHPAGGCAKVDLVKVSDSDILIAALWYVDDLAEGKRRIHLRPQLRLPRDAGVVVESLESEVVELLSTSAGPWNMVSDLEP